MTDKEYALSVVKRIDELAALTVTTLIEAVVVALSIAIVIAVCGVLTTH